VLVVADDTDVLILLLYYATRECNFYLKTKGNTISINVAKEILGREICMCLPFVHVMSGCDTTSAIYSIGKIKHLKLLQSSQKWRSDVLVFGDSSASLQEVTDVGELFIQSLYSHSGGSTLSRGIDQVCFPDPLTHF
jgi:5'-3' exonuclease